MFGIRKGDYRGRDGSASGVGAELDDGFFLGISQMSEEGAGQIEEIESGRVPRPVEYSSDAAWWWGEVQKHSAVFVRRVEVKGVTP